MKIIIKTVLLLTIVFFDSNLFAQTNSDSTYLMQVLGKTEIQLAELNKTLVDNLRKSQNEIDRLSSIISDTRVQSDRKVEALNDKLIEIEKIQKAREDYEKKQREKKFEAGKVALSSMKSGVKILNFTYDLLDLDQTIELTTNIWSDTIFRNTWNQVDDWGTVAGTLIAVGGVLQSEDESAQISGLAIGAGLVGCSKLLGTLFGINEKKLRKKMEKIDLSVRAYDDLNIRNKQLKTFIENNKDFEDRIKSFEIEYINAANGDISLFLIKLVDLLDEYKVILKQIPSYLDNISSVSVSYVNNKERYKELPMEEIFSKILSKCDKLKGDYNKEVKPLLDVSPEIKRLVFSTN